MGKLSYLLLMKLYGFLIRAASLWNEKARKWVAGRENIFENINQVLYGNDAPIAWFHCASLGEFEQARPVIEQFRQEFTGYKVFLTFFSPSGYEVRKNYAGADYIFYLPLDTRANARTFVQLVKPALAFFAKYEFWHFYLDELAQARIPVISFSAIFRPGQLFFRPYGSFYRNVLRNFTHLFVQNQQSVDLLHRISITNVTLAGDTRFDRVQTIVAQKKAIPLAAAFKNNQPLLVIGSSWPQDMDVLVPFINAFAQPLKIIIAPHEIEEAQIALLEKEIRKNTLRFSRAGEAAATGADVLIIDNIGMLSSLYQYGEFAYVGGAFGKGLHNILEAATYGMPVFFGPAYQKFQEANDLVQAGAAIPVRDTPEFTRYFTQVYTSEPLRQQKADTARTYVQTHTGATGIILAFVRRLIRK